MMAYYNNPCWYMVERKRKLVVDEIRRMADYVRRNQDDKSQVQFFITTNCDDAGQDFRWHYSVYESENLLSDTLSQLPGPPTNVNYQTLSSTEAGNSNSPTSISGLLKWDYQDLTGIPYHFVVQYRLKDSFWTDCWLQKTTSKASESQMAVNLFYDRSRVLEFRMAADTCIGRSEFSEIVESQTLHDGHFEMAGEMNKKPEMSDEEPLLPDNRIPNDHPSVGLLSLLGFIQTNSDVEKKVHAVLQQPDAPATAEGINHGINRRLLRKTRRHER
jgi:hypothetical protein